MLKISNNLIFLGKGEIRFAENTFPKYSKKFKFLPFSIDTNFWEQQDIDVTLNKKILFIGNDGNRDYDLFLKLLKHIQKFLLLVSQIISINLKYQKL